MHHPVLIAHPASDGAHPTREARRLEDATAAPTSRASAVIAAHVFARPRVHEIPSARSHVRSREA
jgi:hypothetical protein